MRTETMMPAPMLTVREVSVLCGVDRRTVYYWIERGEINGTRNGFGEIRVGWLEAERVRKEREARA